MLQTFHVRLPGLRELKHIPVVTVLGTQDDLTVSVHEGNTYCNQPWLIFMERTGITAFDLWSPDVVMYG